MREMERRVALGEKKSRKRKVRAKTPVVCALEDSLQDHLATRVEVKEGRGGGGSIEISYHDADDFTRIFELVTGRSMSELVE